MIDMPDWTDFEPKGEREKLAYALMVSGVAIDVPTGGVLLDYELADRLMDALRDQDLALQAATGRAEALEAALRELPWHSHTTISNRDASQVFVSRADVLALLEDKAEPE